MNNGYILAAAVIALPFYVVMTSCLTAPTPVQDVCCVICAYLIAGSIVRIGLLNKDVK